jgi:hypothetical protein
VALKKPMRGTVAWDCAHAELSVITASNRIWTMSLGIIWPTIEPRSGKRPG